MRGWTSMLVGFLLLGVAYWSFTVDGLGASALLCGAAAAFFFIRGAQGASVGEVGDPMAVVEFVKDPADAIVDSATDKIAEWFGDDEKPQAAVAAGEPKAVVASEPPRPVAEGAMDRYYAQRAAEAAVVPASSPPYRGFGRKGVQ